ncbi:MAG: hypothetical protein JW915_02440 [Chitinispirillaceae bacterium]|nr:hypothetical protein [Chitinispirillaceae bacterium]
MRHFPYFQQLVLIGCCVCTLYAQPSEENDKNRPGPYYQMHPDMPPPPPLENGIAFKPDGVLPDPMMLRDPVRLKSFLVEIGINDRSKEQILSLVRDFNNSMEERILRMQQEEINIKTELLKENPDLAAIQKNINKKSQIFSEIEFAQIKRDIGIKKLLSDEEFELWKSLMRKQMLLHMKKFKNVYQRRDDTGSGRESR